MAGLVAFHVPLPGAVGALVLWWLCRHRLPSRITHLLFIVCFGTGALVSMAATPVPPSTATLAAIHEFTHDQRADTIRGVVHRMQPRPGRTLRILLSDVQRIAKNGTTTPLPGDIAWTWRNPTYRPEPGQTVTVRFKLKPVHGFRNPGTWDYEAFWARRGVFFRGYTNGDKGGPVWGERPGAWTWNLRERLRDRTIRALGGERNISRGGGVIVALLFGDRYFLAPDEMQRMGRASLAHTLALSGLHVGLVAAFGAALAWLAGALFPALYLRMARQRIAVLTAAPLVAAYVWLGQASPSLTRAAIMFAAWGALLFMGRSRVLLDGLFLALACILFADPVAVTDLGLQMSATAVAGIAMLDPAWRAMRTLRRNIDEYRIVFRGIFRIGLWAAGLLLVSVAAQLALLPLLARSFGYVSLSPWTNLLWLPALGLVVLPLSLTGLACTGLGLSAFGAQLLQLAATAQNHLFTVLDMLTAHGLTPWTVCLRPHWLACIGYWGALVLLAAALHARPGTARGRVHHPATALGALVLLLAPTCAALWPDGDTVSLTLLDVGQGQAVLLQTPDNHRYLIDGGGLWPGFDVGSAVVGPMLTHNRPPRLSGVILTHPDHDHWGGLAYILTHFSVGWFGSNGDTPTGKSLDDYRAALAAFGTSPRLLHAGDRIPLDHGLRLDVLHPPTGYPGNTNNRSVVLRLVLAAGDTERGLALMPGDIQADAIDTLLASGTDLSAEVLVLPHHGARSSLSPALYRRTGAEAALASCGFLNYFGFPAQQVRAAVQRAGMTLRTTADEGAIQVRWNVLERSALPTR